MFDYDEEKLKKSFESVHRLIYQTLKKPREEAIPFVIHFLKTNKEIATYLGKVPLLEESDWFHFKVFDYEFSLDITSELIIGFCRIEVKSKKHREVLRSVLLSNGFIRKIKNGQVKKIWENFDLLIEVYDIYHEKDNVYMMYYWEHVHATSVRLGFSQPTNPSIYN